MICPIRIYTFLFIYVIIVSLLHVFAMILYFLHNFFGTNLLTQCLVSVDVFYMIFVQKNTYSHRAKITQKYTIILILRGEARGHQRKAIRSQKVTHGPASRPGLRRGFDPRRYLVASLTSSRRLYILLCTKIFEVVLFSEIRNRVVVQR